MNSKYVQEYLKAGDVVEATLDNRANVILLDFVNFMRFKNNKKFKYFGGLVEEGDCKIVVPATGMWYVVVQPLDKDDLHYTLQIIKPKRVKKFNRNK